LTEAMPSSLTTLRVLELVGEHQPVAVSEVARLIDRPKSTAQRALLTLHEGGWIRPSGTDRTRWLLTARVANLARQFGNQTGLREAAAPALRALRQDTNESVSLCILDGDETVSIDFAEGHHPMRLISPVGVRLPLHAGSSGKVILAHLPDDVANRVLTAPMRAFTQRTVVEPTKVLRDLAEIRRDGYGVSRGEVTKGAVGIAAVIRDPSGFPMASLAVLVPDARASSGRVRTLGRQTSQSAAEVERALAAMQ
jgi:IclR family transcriptional regulator, acetate operon repressor